MDVQITRTTPIYRSAADTGIFLQWVVNNPPVTGISHFSIERSGSPEGPFEPVIEHLDSYHFFDNLRDQPAVTDETLERENLNFLSLSRGIYYKVTAYPVSGDPVFGVRDTGATLSSKKITLLRRKMQRDITVGFKFNGIDFAVLKRRHWGIRCDECFDKLTKKTTRSKCESCYGTGFEGGYFAPVRIRGRIGVDSVQTDDAPQGKAEVNQARLTMLTIPKLEHADIIVDLGSNRRFFVQHQHATELQTVAVHQVLTISELSRDSIEYRIPANLEHSPAIY